MDRFRRELENFVREVYEGERKVLVFGEGPLHARVMLVGEAPGEREALEGRPFVGRAGKTSTPSSKARISAARSSTSPTPSSSAPRAPPRRAARSTARPRRRRSASLPPGWRGRSLWSILSAWSRWATCPCAPLPKSA